MIRPHSSFGNKQKVESSPNSSKEAGTKLSAVTNKNQKNEIQASSSVSSSLAPKRQRQPRPSSQSVPKQKPFSSSISAPKDSRSASNPKATAGGVLSKGSNNTQVHQGRLQAEIHQTLGYKDVFDSIKQITTMKDRTINKIIQNYTHLVKNPKEPENLQSIYEFKIHKEDGKESQVRFIKIDQIEPLQFKQKNLISMFWCSVISKVCKEIKYVSQSACLNAVQVHIKLNKDFYLNQGVLNLKKFPQYELFPIINGKASVNQNSPFFIKVASQVENLINDFFSHLNIIFKLMAQMHQEQKEKFQKVFSTLDERKFEEIAKHMLQSYRRVLHMTEQSQQQSSYKVLDHLTESMLSYYKVSPQKFSIKFVETFLKILDEAYPLINTLTQSNSKFRSSIQKLILKFLMNCPFKIDKWNQGVQEKVTMSNLSILQPFKLLLDVPITSQFIKRIHLKTSQIWWKPFIDALIKKQYTNPRFQEYTIGAISSMLKNNSDLFWTGNNAETIFLNFRQYVLHIIQEQGSRQHSKSIKQSRMTFHRILTIASSLVEGGAGKRQNRVYPQIRQFPNALYVFENFGELFLEMNKWQFFKLIKTEVQFLMRNPSTTKSDIDLVQSAEVVHEFLLKLLSADPTTLNVLAEPHQEQHLLQFLIFDTISESTSISQKRLELAYLCLDKQLTFPGYSQKVVSIFKKLSQQRNIQTEIKSLFKQPNVYKHIIQHVNVLISQGYINLDWTIEILKNLHKISVYEPIANLGFYAQFLADLFSRYNNSSKQMAFCIKSVRPFINFSFSVDFLKYILKLAEQNKELFNVLIKEEKLTKYESLIKGVKLLDKIIIGLQIDRQRIKSSNSSNKNTLFSISQNKKRSNNLWDHQRSGSSKSQQEGFYPDLLRKQLISKDSKLSSKQVSTLNGNTTSYICALSAILTGISPKQRDMMRKIDHNYVDLILQCMETIVKLHPDQSVKGLFNVTSSNKLLVNDVRMQEESVSLKKFITYAETSQQQSALQILIFGNLCQWEKLRRIIDRVRINIQNRSNREKMKDSKILRIVATLSRYFDFSIKLIMTNQRDQQYSLKKKEIRDHLQFVLESIVLTIQPYLVRSSSIFRNKFSIPLNNIAGNIYRGFLNLHLFNRECFVKWIKTFHRLLFQQDLNFPFLSRVGNKYDEQALYIQEEGGSYHNDISSDNENDYNSSYNKLNQDYFALCIIFFNCKQYFSNDEYMSVISVEGFTEQLGNYINGLARMPYEALGGDRNNDNIAKVNPNFNLNDNSSNQTLKSNLLQLMVASLRMYSQLKDYHLQNIKSTCQQLMRKHSTLNHLPQYAVLTVFFADLLDKTIQSSAIDFDQPFWPLLINCLDQDYSPDTFKRLIDSLKQKNINNSKVFNISICRGISRILNNISDWYGDQGCSVIDQLFGLFQWQLHQSVHQNREVGRSNPAITSSSAYRTVWTCEFLLQMFTNPNVPEQLLLSRLTSAVYDNRYYVDKLGELIKLLANGELHTKVRWMGEDCYEHREAGMGFRQKLQLNQLLKLLSFVFVARHDEGSNCSGGSLSHRTSQRHYLIQSLFDCSELFQSLLVINSQHIDDNSGQNPSSSFSFAQSDNEHRAEQIGINNENKNVNASLSRGILSRERSSISSVIKSSNYLQLMHEILHVELSGQFGLLCLAARYQMDDSGFISGSGLPFHYNKEQESTMRKTKRSYQPNQKQTERNQMTLDFNHIYNHNSSDDYDNSSLSITNCNIIFLKQANNFVDKYLSLYRHKQSVQAVLKQFTEMFYSKDQPFSQEMLLTNAPSMSSSLPTSYQELIQLMKDILQEMFEKIYFTIKRMKDQLRVEHDSHRKKFLEIVKKVKDNIDKNASQADFEFNKYNDSADKLSYTRSQRTMDRSVSMNNY